MFVRLQRTGARSVSLIGLTSDALCVRLYYPACCDIEPRAQRRSPPPYAGPATVSHPPRRPACSFATPSPLYRPVPDCHTHAHMPRLTLPAQSYPMCRGGVMECLAEAPPRRPPSPRPPFSLL
uniref:Uncharacterized protein n=1 Tax=Knipowitschia caucasica TaxID=637954 RepID=A0AAV2JIN3_KNICA